MVDVQRECWRGYGKGYAEEMGVQEVGTFRPGICVGSWSAQTISPLLISRYSNLDLQTQEAYEMAVKGLVRPMTASPMLITGIRCIHFAPPEFILGMWSPLEIGAARWDPWSWQS